MKTSGKPTRNTTIKVRLYPTPPQAALIDKTFASCRWLWNAMLHDEREFYAATGEHFIPTPARYKKEAPFLKEVDSQALVTVHQNLRRAFQEFFRDSSVHGYPQFKRPYSRDAYTVYCQYYDTSPPSIYATENGVKLPKLGVVRANMHRKPLHWWTLRAATVSKTRSGKYFCSLLYGYEEKPPEPVAAERVAEVGAASEPENVARAREKLDGMEQKLARMTRGSNNYEALRRRIVLQREHIENQRRDYAHKESRRIADAFDAVRADGADARLRENLRYKLERQGKQLIE